MGMNLESLQSPSELSGSPGRRSTPCSRVLFVNTSIGKDQSVNMHKTPQIRSKLPLNLLQWVVHDFRRVLKLVS
jgi:hypothetical protein